MIRISDSKIQKRKEEYLSCFKIENLKRFHTGNLAPYVFPVKRSIAHKEKIPHIVIRLFAQSLDGKYLVQKRSKNKKRNSELWTDTASGHVNYYEGEKEFCYERIEATVERELKEEMGVELKAIRFYKMEVDKTGEFDHELAYVFLGIVNDKLKLDNYEVDEESGFFSKIKLKNMLDNEKWVKNTEVIWNEILEGKVDNLFKGMISEINNGLYDDSNKPSEAFNNGLIIGRFQPLHNGHIYLIKKAFEYVKFLKIGVGSSQFSDEPKNPFSYDIRKLFIDLSMSDENIHPRLFKIYPIPDRFDIYKWIDTVFETVGDFDAIFTNNLWIGRLFQQRNKIMIYGLKYDFERFKGTHVRDLLFNNKAEWTKLVPHSVARYITDPEILKQIKEIAKKCN